MEAPASDTIREKPVLKDVELEVSAGEMIGLVGKSGAGKTTFINLICRFYDVTRGAIEVDGVDIRNMKLEDLRHQIGLVAQQSFLFNRNRSRKHRLRKSQVLPLRKFCARREPRMHTSL